MIQSLIDNLGSLVLAFLLALMVWMVAVSEGQGPPVTQKYPPEGVPVETVNIPEGLVIVGSVNQTVQVEVRAPRSYIDRLAASDFEAFVDLAGLAPGVHEVPVQVQCAQCNQKQVNMLGWEPNRISIRLDEAAQRTVQVQPNLQGGTAIGYQAEMPTVQPDQVIVSGPRSVVERVSSVRADIYLFNDDATVEKEVTLVAIDAEGNVVGGVTLNPRRVSVTVPIVPEGRRKEVAVTPKLTGTVASGYYVSGISVDPQTVVLTGSQSSIQDAPGFVETDLVNIDGADSSIEIQVPVRIPEGLQLLDPADQTVTVHVEVSPFTGGRDFEVAPMIRNLGPGLKADISPPQVQVFVSGPIPVLEQMTTEDIQVILDLSDRPAGRHRITPTVVVSREGLATRTVPDVVEVTITTEQTATPQPTPTTQPTPTARLMR